MTTSDIPTATPTRRRRLAALALDYLVIVLIGVGVGVIAAIMWAVNGRAFPDFLGRFGPLGTQAIMFCFITLPVGVYLFLSESGRRHATWGKRRLGLRVEATTGDDPARGAVLVRTIVKLLPWELGHALVWQLQDVSRRGIATPPALWGLTVLVYGLALTWLVVVLVRRDGRGPHDLAAGTRVVQTGTNPEQPR